MTKTNKIKTNSNNKSKMCYHITLTSVRIVGPTKFPFSYPGTLTFLPSKIILAPSSIPDWIKLCIFCFASGDMTGPTSVFGKCP